MCLNSIKNKETWATVNLWAMTCDICTIRAGDVKVSASVATNSTWTLLNIIYISNTCRKGHFLKKTRNLLCLWKTVKCGGLCADQHLLAPGHKQGHEDQLDKVGLEIQGKGERGGCETAGQIVGEGSRSGTHTWHSANGKSSALYCNLLQSLWAKLPLKCKEMSNQLLLKWKKKRIQFTRFMIIGSHFMMEKKAKQFEKIWAPAPLFSAVLLYSPYSDMLIWTKFVDDCVFSTSSPLLPSWWWSTENQFGSIILIINLSRVIMMFYTWVCASVRVCREQCAFFMIHYVLMSLCE